MNGLVMFITAFLAALGAFELLNDSLERVKRPRRWVGLSKDRRTFIMLVAALLFALVRTPISVISKSRSRAALSLLRELDVRFDQIEALTINLLETSKFAASTARLNKIAERLASYGTRLGGERPTLENWAWALGEVNGRKMEDQVGKISKQIKDWSSSGEEKFNPARLADLSEEVTYTHALIRTMIDDYIS